jgi:hypothetical protein
LRHISNAAQFFTLSSVATPFDINLNLNMALLTNLPNELLISIISHLQSDPPILCSLSLQCRRLSSLIRPFLYKYLYLKPNKHVLLLRSINDNPQLVSFIKFVGISGNWNDLERKGLMGRLEREGVVFWSLPDAGYCGDLRLRMGEGDLRKEAGHYVEGIGRDLEGGC